MPTGRCNFPEHHGPSAGPPLAMIGLIALGAVIVAFWHLVIVALIVVLLLAGVAAAVVALLHNHRRHYDPALEQRAAVQERAPAALPQRQPGAVEAPHYHLHLHGVTADDAAHVARQLHARRED